MADPLGGRRPQRERGFAYTVGLDQPLPTTTSIFLPAGQGDDIGRPNVLAVVARWLGCLGASLVVGGPWFLVSVLWPALRIGGAVESSERGRSRIALADLGKAASKRLSQLLGVGVVLACVGALTGLLAQAISVAPSDPASLRAAPFDLLGTRSGLLFGCRLLALGVIALGVRNLARWDWTEQRPALSER